MRPSQVEDKRYPQVKQAMEPSVVQDLLNKRLTEANRGVRFEDFSVDYSFYVPGRNFRIVYRGEIVNGSSRTTQLLFGRIPYTGDHQERYLKVQNKLRKGRYVQPELGEGAYHLPELGMVLWTFPNDPRLKTLPQLLEPQALNRIFRQFAHRVDWELGAHGYDMVRYIPSKRCVLRFQIEWRGPRPADPTTPIGSGGAPASELETLYGKVYESQEATAVAWNTLQDLWNASQQHRSFLRIPQPLHLERELQTIWVARVPGEPLTLQAAEVSRETFAEIGIGLSLLHQSAVRTQGQYPLETECTGMLENAAAIGNVHPDMRSTLAEITDSLQRHLPKLARLPLVASHGTFKLNHLMSDGGPLSLLDFDSMAAADPLFDVANFTSDLHYLEAQGDLPTGRAAEMAAVFQEAYFANVPWGRRPRTLDWYVASLLLRKQAYKTVKHLHGDAVAKISSVVQEALSRTRRLDT